MNKRIVFYLSTCLLLSFLCFSFSPDTTSQVEEVNAERGEQAYRGSLNSQKVQSKRLNYCTSVQSLQSVTESIRPLFLSEKYKERINFVNDLSDSLSTDERDALYFFLLSAGNDWTLLHIKDRILCKLGMQIPRPPELEGALVQFVQDSSLDGCLRGYVVQHLRLVFDQPETDKEYLRDVLFNVLEDTGTDVAGTAILSLSALSQKDMLIDKELVAEKAYEILTNESTCPTTKVSALQVCGDLHYEPALKIARNIALDEESTIACKCASVGVISQLGGATDLPLLNKFKEKQIVRNAAIAAINSINQILNNK